jgi:acyl-CoA thioesterase-1
MFSEFTFRLKLLAVLLLVLSSPCAYTSETTVLVFGDSISAAYGMDQNEGWVNLLSEHFKGENRNVEVINASVSGETTGGGRVRLPKTLEIHQPDIVVLELGGNDGLRGYPIDKIQGNLEEMTRLSLEAGARVLLIGMVLPPNYGKRYTDKFEGVFPEIASAHGIDLIPFLLDGIATSQSLMQRDGIHPKPEAQQLLLRQILPKVEELLTPR